MGKSVPALEKRQYPQKKVEKREQKDNTAKPENFFPCQKVLVP